MWRQLPAFDPSFHPLLNFSSNDYLCLSKHPMVLRAAIDAIQRYGMGSTGSRLLSGNYSMFQDFEKDIAFKKKTQAALIFNSGFQANVGALGTICHEDLLGDKAIVFFDKENHASLYQGVKVSGATCIRYAHHNLDHLESLLCRYPGKYRFIVCETLHGMNGDLCPLKDLVFLAQKHDCFLYLDEAHAVGVIGENGYGLSTTVDLSSIECLIMGTFSKAIGACGGYVCSSKTVINLLVNFSPSFIYATALAPPVIAASFKAWKMLPSFEQERSELLHKSCYLRNRLRGNDVSSTPIVPIPIQTIEDCLAIKNFLFNHGILVSAIRPPTVPPKGSRLRVSLHTGHTYQDIDRLVDLLGSYTLDK